jgi:pyridoxamine 5'-phosphate oxidase
MPALAENILEKFDQWFAEAEHHPQIRENNAMNLATANREGYVTNRMVLLKEHDAQGFVFYTNLESRKGQHLLTNPRASLCFYWEPLSKQIRIEGQVQEVSAQEADAYFNSRPLKSRIGAWASKQSRPLQSKQALLKEVAKQGARFVTQEVPRPPYWSGFRLIPDRLEFWKAGEYRIHDRICFQWNEAQARWDESLLYP